MSIQGIVLAGGYSKRAGCFKMTRQICGKPLIEYCIENMYDACGKITVVTGYRQEKLQYLKDKYEKISLMYNKEYDKGMFSSVLAGIKTVTENKAFIIPGDYPAVSPQTYKLMSDTSSDILIPLYKGKYGHPVLVNKKIINKINKNCTSLKDFIFKQGFETISVNDAGILYDVDKPSDFEAIYKYLKEGIW